MRLGEHYLPSQVPSVALDERATYRGQHELLSVAKPEPRSLSHGSGKAAKLESSMHFRKIKWDS